MLAGGLFGGDQGTGSVGDGLGLVALLAGRLHLGLERDRLRAQLEQFALRTVL